MDSATPRWHTLLIVSIYHAVSQMFALHHYRTGVILGFAFCAFFGKLTFSLEKNRLLHEHTPAEHGKTVTVTQVRCSLPFNIRDRWSAISLPILLHATTARRTPEYVIMRARRSTRLWVVSLPLLAVLCYVEQKTAPRTLYTALLQPHAAR